MQHEVPRSSWLTIALLGGVAIVMGLAFITLRPLVVLLPEDQRFTGMTVEQLRTQSPALFTWIGLVFRSWGAFAVGLGVLLTGIAVSAYRRGERWAWWTVALAGLSTFTIFLKVNFVLGSDFRWVIAALLSVFVLALWGARRAA